MSAFNDYCIVCEKLCASQSAYCSEECKLKDNKSHFNFNNVPQLISPALQPRTDSQQQPIETDEEIDLENKKIKHDYLIKSPLLLSSSVKEQQPIAGLNLNDFIPREDSSLDQHHAQLLAVSSNNYKKWLNVVL